MCGISGLFSRKLSADVRKLKLNKALETHKHRGPDSLGVFTDDQLHISLGMTRLSITDEENGDQPFISEDGNNILFFNGEVFNFEELRREFESTGIIFKTNSDTEVLFHGLVAQGIDFLKNINGFFVFCFVDLRQNNMTLARDGIGVKPLFYTANHNEFTFSSEMRSVLEVSSTGFNLDIDSIAEYLNVGFLSSPKTMFSGVKQLMPGEMIEFDLRKGQIIRQELWFNLLEFFHESKGILNNVKLKTCLTHAVKNRFQSDGEKPNILLSGGIDSNIIRHAMGKRKVIGYSATFSEEVDSEINRISKSAVSIKELSLKFEDCIDLFDECIKSLELPVNDTAIFPTFKLCEKVSKNSKVVFSGLGADEFFLGYARHSDGLFVERFIRRIIPRAVLASFSKFGGKMAKRISWNAKSSWQRYLGKISIFEHSDIEKILNRKFVEVSKPKPFKNWKTKIDSRELMGLYDALYYLPNNILYLSDKMSMANSVEIREPFLDVSVLKLAFQLNAKDKLPIFPKRIFKKVLRKEFEDAIPLSVINGAKKGFAGPTEVWFNSGKLQDYASKRLSSSRLVKDNVISAEYVDKMLIANFCHATPNQIISILILEIWYQHYRKYLK